MNTSIHTLPAPATSTQPLWAAVGVLGVAVIALGASLVHVQSRPLDGHAALAAINSNTPTLLSTDAVVHPADTLGAREDLVAPPAHPPVVPAKPAAARPAVQATPAPVSAAPSAATTATTASSGPAVPAPRTQVCANCGTIEAVTPIQRNARSGSGVGMVAGGALGAVLGNQIGKGSGRTVATILGAVGGGIAGNAIEKNIKKETTYQVQVRMEDGSMRTIDQGRPATVGARVTLDGGTLRSADQGAAAPAPARSKPVVRQQPGMPQDNNRA